MTVFRPMLAATAPEDLSQLRYPLYASHKLDGIRALVRDGVVVSRNLKPIPCPDVQDQFGRMKYEGFDGELIFGSATSPSCFRDTTSAVMRHAPLDYPLVKQLQFFVFDHVLEPSRGFTVRFHPLERRLRSAPGVRVVSQTLVTTPEELLEYEECAVGRGYEGVMLRDPSAPYKYGRSTLAEGYLLKLKRFLDGEAVVVAVKELEHNMNVAAPDALGYTARSSRKAGRQRGGRLGALCVRDVKTEVEFDIGTGFTAQDRMAFWAERDALIGRVLTYRYFPTGSKERPRFPVFVGWRHPLDTPA